MPQSTGQVVAFLNLRLHDDGAMSIEGNIDNWKMCQNMLDAAHAALRKKYPSKDDAPLTRMIDPSVVETGVRP